MGLEEEEEEEEKMRVIRMVSGGACFRPQKRIFSSSQKYCGCGGRASHHMVTSLVINDQCLKGIGEQSVVKVIWSSSYPISRGVMGFAFVAHLHIPRHCHQSHVMVYKCRLYQCYVMSVSGRWLVVVVAFGVKCGQG